MKKRELEFNQRISWIVDKIGGHCVGSVKFEVHANRKNFDEFMKEIGHAHLCGEDAIEVLCPIALTPVVVKHYDEVQWEVFSIPDRASWTNEERGNWLAINN